MTGKDLLRSLSESSGVSGYESKVAEIIREAFTPISDQVTIDRMGNLTAYKKAVIEDAPTIMLAAHMDEIGLIVTKIEEEGFLRFSSVGGIDPRTLVSQEVLIHGKEEIPGVIGAKPPHLSTAEERKKALKMDKLFIDPGIGKAEVEKYISVGDIVTLQREFMELENDVVAGKSLDDRAGVVMLYHTLEELKYLQGKLNLYAVATVQEELGVRGAQTSSYQLNPDLGIAIDVCHATMPGVDKEDAAELGKGPAIGFGPHVHPKIYKGLKDVAEETGLSYQIEPSPSPRGTDAWAIQIARGGIASGLVSIPLRYMHTSVETLSLNDIKRGGQLLARFIAHTDLDFVEGLKCY